MGVILWSFSMILHKIHQNAPEYRLVIALKQIFQLETIHCMYLDDTLNRLVGNAYLTVTFMRCFLFGFFSTVYNDLCGYERNV